MLEACIPLAIQFVIDDAGWWSGQDEGAAGGPFRTGMGRDHVPADYTAIIQLGKWLNMRPLAAMILCEWDRSNLLKEHPTCTMHGNRWDNRRWNGPWLDEAARIIREGIDHIELGLHGVGHEYWSSDGSMTRAEFHDAEGNMRPKDEVIVHLDCFRQIFHEHNLGPFPESFVPPAYMHHYGRQHTDAIEKILLDYGIRYTSLPFRGMIRSKEPQYSTFGIIHGMLTVNRFLPDLCDWDAIGPDPSGEITGPVCGVHWPNILNMNPDKNLEVTDRWVKLLQPYNERFDRMLAPNTREGFSQVVYAETAALRTEQNALYLDFSTLRGLNSPGILNTFYLKTRGRTLPKYASAGLSIERVQEREAGADMLFKITRDTSVFDGRIDFT